EKIEEEIPGVIGAARFSSNDRLIKIGGNTFESRVSLADPELFEIFDFRLLLGDPVDGLRDPNSVLISENIRDIYFNGQDPVGDVIKINFGSQGYLEFVIRGIVKNQPDNSSIKFNYIIPYSWADYLYGTRRQISPWINIPATTFILLDENVRAESVDNALETIALNNVRTEMESDEKFSRIFSLQKLTDIHLNNNIRNLKLEAVSDPAYSYILGGIALLVLFIAGINFVNLSVGLSTKRAKEVGMRKVFGAKRDQLMKQFLFESILLSVFALFLGLMLAELLLPQFNLLSGKNLVFDYHKNIKSIGIIFLFIIVVGFSAGSYPALILSGLSPVGSLKKALRIGGKNLFTKVMVSLQFSLSAFLIVSSLIMWRQVEFISDKNLGYNTDMVLMIKPVRGIDESTLGLFKEEIGSNVNIVKTAGSNAISYQDNSWGISPFEYKGERYRLPYLKIDYDYLDLMGIDIVSGRNFSKEHPSDLDDGVIVNKKFLDEFRITDPIGKTIEFDDYFKPKIIGIIEDLHFESLRKEIKPMAFHIFPRWSFREVLVMIKPDNVSATVDFIEEKWKQIVPDLPFEFAFLDELIEDQYRSEENWKAIIQYSTFFAITIACLGLFGMTSLSIARRTREMGIRKVLGASASGIVNQFNREYIYLILISNVIALPAAYRIMQNWLQTFAYKIELGILLFVLSALIVMILSVLTIGVLSVKAANSNPADTLRCE
ncbi:MAG: FtsX-like permease family protein, partial [bacterium]|nr:FtsX-like permease family protein [bacterium]